MEITGKSRTLDGINVPAHLSSNIPPYENLEVYRNNRSKRRTRKLRITSPVYIFNSHKSFQELEKLSFRNYYLNFRKRINFVRVNQGILFEKLPKNISERMFRFPNKNLEYFNPTANSIYPFQPNRISFRILPGLVYDMRVGIEGIICQLNSNNSSRVNSTRTIQLHINSTPNAEKVPC